MKMRRSLARRSAIWVGVALAVALVPVGIAVAAALDPSGQEMALLASGLGIAWLAGVVAAVLSQRGPASWVSEMARSAGGVAGREGRVPPPSGGVVELGMLAEALERLRARARRQIDDLEGDRRTRESILSAMAEGIVLVHHEDVAYVNPAAHRLLDGAPQDLRSLAPHALRRLVREARAGGEPRHERTPIGHPARVVQAAAVPLEGGDRVLLVLHDVTESVRVDAMRRDFVADASHELKTPLASIRAAAETLETAVEQDPAGAKRFAARLRRDAERLSRIVSDLLDLSRLETEVPTMKPLRLDRLVAEEAARFFDRAREAGIALRVETGEAEVLGDEKDLELLVANLLDNAIRYTGTGGAVTVNVARQNGRAVLTVRDTGVGIPSRDLPRIFERFYRVDRARSRETGGTGLGLSIARHVVELHGGQIGAESELGRGSTFRVALPARG